MKKILGLILLLVLFTSNVFASETPLHWTATGDNVKMDFDDDTSTVSVINNNFVKDVCGWGWKDGFLLTGSVNREWNWYVYFNDDDSDDWVTGCVAIYLSWNSFYLSWVAPILKLKSYCFSLFWGIFSLKRLGNYYTKNNLYLK